MSPDDDLRWTTSRCNRLLRHISSPLAALRKEWERQQTADGELRNISNALLTKAGPRKTTNFSQLASARKPRGFDKACDPDWVPGAKPSGAKKTYGGRTAKSSTAVQRSGIENVGRPGEITFTPLVARTGGRFQDSPQLQSSPIRPPTKKKGPLIAKVDQLYIKKNMPYDTEKQVGCLFRAYANLLSATAVGEKRRWTGTRSLMGACLRQLPAFIELEGHFAALDKAGEDNNDERDISNEIYSELEDKFETCPGQGWRPFKSIVRAHGTSLLCDAFADQILDVETLHMVVSHCFNASAWDEGEKFLRTYLPTLKPLSTPTTPQADLFNRHTSIYLWTTKSFVDRTGRSRFLYEVLEQMISQETLPLEWLATDCMRPLWHRLVRTLSDGDSTALKSAFRFLETTISVGIGLPDDNLFEAGGVDIVPIQTRPSARKELRKALDTTFLSLLTVLSSIALLNNNRANSSNDPTVQRVTSVLDSMVIGLLRRNNVQSDLDLLEPTPEDMETFAHRALWTMSASFLVHLGGCRLDVTMISLDMPTLVGAINWVALQYSSKNIGISSAIATLPGFISSTARCSGKAWKDDGFDQLQQLADALLSLTGFRLPHKLWNMKRLALESCLEFAQITNNAEHIAFVRQIERSMKEKGHVVLANTPHKSDTLSTGSGFRWEEGIGEWVACTPFIKPDVKYLPRKPIRTLELLPTPIASDDEQEGSPAASEVGDAHSSLSNEPFMWEQVNKDMFPQSSLFKVLSRKRRSTSPMVVIPVKRTRITPPESPAIQDSNSESEPRRICRACENPVLSRSSSKAELRKSCRLVEESIDNSKLFLSSQTAPRRSRRSRKEIKAIISNIRDSRSRASLDSSLRNISRKTYVEVVDFDDSESEREGGDGYTIANEMELNNDDDRDELSKTPAGVNRRRGGRRVVTVKTPRWFVSTRRINGEESEDELSFQ
ncbi:hypothetical protein K505DRAFT_327989 [Melanomma pulvis-pyrius CBS 109.77]|uniref:Uncharacterized protein n=1 Tax=Melanomma pulvis-pyrius CBS 109.77 TaxID=1314802 RepID=A0A6A6X0E7_9PLEO|nr:hypothetical protein K505DRAFT_327989 [Melanomma pulvis-pyrius CBS 109.77]